MEKRENSTSNSEGLSRELERGNSLSRELVLHLGRMGAGATEIPVELGGKKYSVIVKAEQQAGKKCEVDYISELQKIYNSEINFRISCFWDEDWQVEIGDEMNGWKIKHLEETLKEAIEWLIKEVCNWYPNSGYAKRKEGSRR